jgi:hypothetical protein
MDEPSLTMAGYTVIYSWISATDPSGRVVVKARISLTCGLPWGGGVMIGPPGHSPPGQVKVRVLDRVVVVVKAVGQTE